MIFKSKTFFTADTHFGHDAIRRHCERPWSSVDEMDAAMIAEWNDMVPRGSIVYHLGDFAFKNHAKYRHKLNGKIILIKGNHDKMSQKLYSELFTEVHSALERKFFGKFVTLYHYKQETWNCSHFGSWHFYGHSHGRLVETNTSFCCDVGVDVWGYRPVPWEVLVELMEEKTYKIKQQDRHARYRVLENAAKHDRVFRRYLEKNK